MGHPEQPQARVEGAGSVDVPSNLPTTADVTSKPIGPDAVEIRQLVEEVHIIIEQNKDRISSFVAQRLDDVHKEVEQRVGGVSFRKEVEQEESDDESPFVPLASRASDAFNANSVTHRVTAAPTRRQPKAVFADAATMKEKVREVITKKPYNVCDFYHETGYAQQIARSSWFETVTLGVIAVNAIWVAVDTDWNYSDNVIDADPVFQVAENLFCTFFTFEWIIRWLAFRRKRDGLQDGWFCFDFILLALMVSELWVMSLVQLITGFRFARVVNASFLKIFRMLRLARMARMAKLLRAVPELMILIKGMLVATRSVVFTLALLILVTYFFAVLFVQLTVEREDDGTPKDPEHIFNSVLGAMETLLLDGVIPDQAAIVREAGKDKGGEYVYAFLVVVFILVASLTVMNMLVGVLVEVVSIVSAVEKESLAVNYVKMQLEEMLEYSGVDVNGDRMISKMEFQGFLLNRKAACAMQNVGVDVVGLVDFSDFLFKEGKEQVSFGEFIELVMSLRGTNTATVKDIVDLRKHLNKALSDLKDLSQTNRRESASSKKRNSSQMPGSAPISVKNQLARARTAMELGSTRALTAASLRPSHSPPPMIVSEPTDPVMLSSPRSDDPPLELPFEAPPLPSQMPFVRELSPDQVGDLAHRSKNTRNLQPAGHYELRRAAETGTTGLAKRIPDFSDGLWAEQEEMRDPAAVTTAPLTRTVDAHRRRPLVDEKFWPKDEA